MHSQRGRSWQLVYLVGGVIVVFNGSLATWILVRPGGQSLYTAVDNLAQVIGPMLVLPICFGWFDRFWRHSQVGGPPASVSWTQRLAPILLGLGVLADTSGQAIWTYYALVLHQSTPFPSWADAAYLCEYPLWLAGILLLLQRPVAAAYRARVTLDGVMTMTAAITFSCYFVLGPTLLQGGETPFAKLIGTAYPVADLVLLACLVPLAARVRDRLLRPVVILLAVGLGCIVVSDSIFDYQTLHNTYGTGELIDVGWPLGAMLICLAAGVLRALSMREDSASESESVDPLVEARAREERPVWGSLLPYALVPCVGMLLLYTSHLHGDERYKPGVILGCTALIGLVLLRQVLAIIENAQLSRSLRAKNTALVEANARLEMLATTDPLTGLPNHRSLMAALEHELERARRYHRPYSVIFLDVDHFKALNDSLGHASGDAALRELGALARRTLRGIDIVGRWSGEEFLAILPETDGETALQAAERFRAAVAAHSFPVGEGIRLTCSLGVSTFPHDAEDRDGLVAMADRAMYAAKRLGRNQVRTMGDPGVSALTAEMGPESARSEAELQGTVEALAALVAARDHYTGQHTQQVAMLSMRLALALGLDANQTHLIGLAARLHDIGKVAVPDAILQKPGRLTPEEWDLIRAHPVVGADVVSRVAALSALAPVIRGHHERWDGSGYPDRLAGYGIPLGARIVAVADAYGAMTTDRPYQARMAPAIALKELQRGAGTQFDAAVVDAIARVLTVEPLHALQQEAV